MQELFRFYAIRASDPVPASEYVPLETSSEFQAGLRRLGRTPPQMAAAARDLLAKNAAIVLRDLESTQDAFAALHEQLSALEPTESDAPVDKWAKAAFGQGLAQLVSDSFRASTDRMKDVTVALRVLRSLGGADASEVDRLMSVQASAGVTARFLPALFLQLRLRSALERAAAAPVTVAAMKAALTLPLTYDLLDQADRFKVSLPFPPGDLLLQHRTTLTSLTEFILRVRLACPSGLRLSGKDVYLAEDVAQQLVSDFDMLISTVNAFPGAAIPADLGMKWLDLHAALEAKAKALQKIIDDETPAAAVATSPTATSPIIGGHMQLAGVADVHVVLNHVIGYEKAEVAQIENILLGERRDRMYRTLLRNEQDTESTTETTTTQEREVKTEDRSDLKAEIDTTLKETLDIKAGLDVEYKPSDSLKLNINASVAYNRSKDETNKVATEFAKDVTNTAAQKVVQMVRQSTKVKVLNETEETVEHTFDNTSSTHTDNIAGVYQWIEKVYENVHLTVGGPAAIFDGIVLQPAQRLLEAPPAADGALGHATPPPVLDVTPSDIHPWNYLSLAAKFSATGLPAPPAFTSNASFSGAAADPNPQGVAHDIAMPDDGMAAWAAIVWDAQDKKGDDPLNADARASFGTAAMTSDIVTGHATKDVVLLLAGERTIVPFAGLFYDAVGYECTIDVTCVRTPEAYERWQLSVYAALSAARAQAQQAYDESVARATLQASYDYAPSPGRVEQLIRDELKRCAIGVLAKQAAAKNIFARLNDLYAGGQLDEVARLCLIYEHAFAWENMSYVLYPYFWADNRGDGWSLHTARSENDENWAEFLRAGAARVVVPVRDGFIRLEALGIPSPDGTADPPGPNPLQMLQEDISAILDETLTFDDLLSISSSKALSAAKESALRAEVMSQWVEHEHWFVRTPTELVILRPLSAALPGWIWNEHADLSQGIAKAWLDQP
jgi:hypothetical protein